MRIAWCVALLGCGRIGFDDRGSTDAGDTDSVDAKPLTCVSTPSMRVTGPSTNPRHAVIVWTGSRYAIAWDDARDGNREIYLKLVDANGADVSGEIRITNTGAASTLPSLAWTGDSFGLMWAEGNAAPYMMKFQRLDPAGARVGAELTLANPAGGFLPTRSQRWNGAHAVAWQTNGPGNDEVFFMQLTGDGTLIGAEARVTNDPAPSSFPSVAKSSSGFGIAFGDERDGQAEIYFAALDASGQKVGADVRLTNAPDTSFAPTIDWNGTNFGVSWWDRRSGTSEMYFAQLGPAGGRIGNEVQIQPGLYGQAGVMRWSGTHWGDVWFDFRNNILEPYFAVIDTTGNVTQPIRVSNGNIGIDLETLDIVYGTRFAIAWADARAAGLQLYLAFVDCN